MQFKRGSLVAYAGRAAEVMGVQPFTLPSGRSIDCLVLAYTGLPRALARVPVERVAETVRRISKCEAEHLDANVPQARSRMANQLQRARAAAAVKLAVYGAMGAAAKQKNRERVA